MRNLPGKSCVILSWQRLLFNIYQLKGDIRIHSPPQSLFLACACSILLTDSAMSASGVQIEGTTFMRVKILDYHDMLPFLLPIHLYKHQNMINL